MSLRPEEPVAGDEAASPDDARRRPAATLPEDLLLLLFQPDSGTIAGENTLFYVLAAAVLADLALGEQIAAENIVTGSVRVKAVPGRVPDDEILRETWDYVSHKSRGVQGLLASVGPPLRARVLDRLVDRGEIRRIKRKVLGLFESTVLVDGETGYRAELLRQVRDVLVHGAEHTPRASALAALLWGSGTLPQFHRDIPWTSAVLTRAQELQQRNWGAGAAAEAVTRTMAAVIAGSVIVAATSSPRN